MPLTYMYRKTRKCPELFREALTAEDGDIFAFAHICAFDRDRRSLAWWTNLSMSTSDYATRVVRIEMEHPSEDRLSDAGAL